MKTWQYPSCGQGNIQAYRWDPAGKPKAIVQFVHGIAEHAKRYDTFARYLNEQGIAVVAEDHMGHGASIGKEDTQGYFTGGWMAAVEDTHKLQADTAAQFPHLPYFLYGHSMGSFMTRTFLLRYPQSGLAGAIIAGTGWQPAGVLKAGLLLCRREEKKHGATGISPTVNRMMFRSYNKGIDDSKSSYAWLSTDEAVVRAYEQDPLCGFDCTVGLGRDMLTGLTIIQNRKNLQNMNKQLPVLFLSGDKDPVGNYGKGVRHAYEAFRQCGMQDVTLHLYPGGRHEIHNEHNKEQVFEDVLSWMFQKANCDTPAKQAVLDGADKCN